MSVKLQSELANRNRSNTKFLGMNSSYEDSYWNKSKMTNFSTTVPQDEQVTRNRLPVMSTYSNWKVNTDLAGKSINVYANKSK